MPYIQPHRRYEYDAVIDKLVKRLVEIARRDTTSVFAGDLNYIVSSLLARTYQSAADMEGFDLGYSDFAEIISVLENAKLELARRLLAPYEDQKKKENGDFLPEALRERVEGKKVQARKRRKK